MITNIFPKTPIKRTIESIGPQTLSKRKGAQGPTNLQFSDRLNKKISVQIRNTNKIIRKSSKNILQARIIIVSPKFRIEIQKTFFNILFLSMANTLTISNVGNKVYVLVNTSAILKKKLELKSPCLTHIK